MVIHDHPNIGWQSLNLNWYRIADPICVGRFVSELPHDPNATVPESNTETASRRRSARSLPIVNEVRANSPHTRAVPLDLGRTPGSGNDASTNSTKKQGPFQSFIQSFIKYLKICYLQS